MVERETEHGFARIIKAGLSYVSQIISASVLPTMAEGAEIVMKNIDDRIIRIEKRILGDICSLLIIGFGGVFLIFALFFYLRDFLGWNNAAAFFSIGMTVFVIGLLLKIRDSKR